MALQPKVLQMTYDGIRRAYHRLLEGRTDPTLLAKKSAII